MFSISKITLLLFLIMISCKTGFSQKRELSKANSEFDKLQYHSAIEYYKKAIKKIGEDTHQKRAATFKIAECYRLMNDPDKAEPFYGELIAGNYRDNDPALYLRYADVLKTQGKVNDAKAYYRKYLKKKPASHPAKLGLKSCDWILANEMNRGRVKVTEIPSINSGYDDFAPAFYTAKFDALIFTSNRDVSTGKLRDQWTGSDFSDLFTTVQSGNTWSHPVLLEEEGVINTNIHEGTPSLNGTFSTIYFTRCERKGDRNKYCKILKAAKDGSEWMKPEVVFSDSTANMGQPSVSKDELMIVFSSDRTRGAGGKDIWIATRKNKEESFGKPVNPGRRINTFGDEMFPFLYNDTILFFSSTGRQGYGGLDIYKSVFRKQSWSAPENLLTPVNSGYDDFGIIFKVLDTEGYFSSNRPGGKGGDDIYRFTERALLFTITGQVKDHMTLLKMEGLTVMLANENQETIRTVTDAQGYFKFDTSQVLEDHSYELIIRKENYFTEKESISTRSWKGDHDFFVEVLMQPIPEKPIVLPDILFPLDEWILEPQYQDSLMQLVEILNDNETLVIELRSHTDSRASYEYNDELSQKRAQAVVDFLISRGIDPGRLVAKGYGERITRTLDKDIYKENYRFKKGTELTDEFVYALPSTEIQEAAFHLNRRTEFAVLAKDYKPKSQKAGSQAPIIQLISDTAGIEVEYNTTAEGKMQVKTYINDFGVDAIFDPGTSESVIDERIVLHLLQQGALDRNDFQEKFEEVFVDDHIKENTILTLDKVRLGELLIHNSTVRVKKDTGNILVIGKDMLEKAGTYTIDKNKRRILFNK